MSSYGDVHAAQFVPSIEHSNVRLSAGVVLSVPLKTMLAVVWSVVAGGPDSIVATGGIAIVQVYVAGVASTKP